jgi:hypothetical protein
VSDALQWGVRAQYDGVRDDAMWNSSNAELDRWLLDVHANHPVSLFVKPIDDEYPTEIDAWHDWSCERVPTEALPIIAALGKQQASVATHASSAPATGSGKGPTKTRRGARGFSPMLRAESRTRRCLCPVQPESPSVAN